MWASVDHLTVDEILDQEEFEIPFERQARRNAAKEAIVPCHASIRTLSRLYLHLYSSEIFVAIQLPEPASPFAFAVKGIQIHACFDFLLHGSDEGCAGVVADFLSSFRGLRDLCLRLSNFPSNESLVEGTESHQSTLRSLVYHERQLIPLDDHDGLFEDERDVSPVWIADLSSVVDLRQITALALSMNPAAAVSFVIPPSYRF